MATRLELHEELCTFLGNDHAYYEPPESIKLKYPCFVYGVDDIEQIRANNRHYLDFNEYSITYITSKIDNNICERFFEAFPSSTFDRSYVADNLHHYVFTLKY